MENRMHNEDAKFERRVAAGAVIFLATSIAASLIVHEIDWNSMSLKQKIQSLEVDLQDTCVKLSPLYMMTCMDDKQDEQQQLQDLRRQLKEQYQKMK